MQKTALILGGTGRFGRHATEAFWNAGWTVRLFDRKRDDLTQSAMGSDVIIAAWNPPYTQWANQVLELHTQVQEAAHAASATVILPGNVYVYAAKTKAPWSEAKLHTACNPLGKIRIDLEQSYRDSGVQTIVLRAGDFIDTEASGNWFDKVMAPTLPRGKLTYPGRIDIPHA